MDIIGPKICPRHNRQARFMCTKISCFEDKDILVCPQCSKKHVGHQSDLIQTNLLNEKVHQLMKKRMDFQQNFEKACDELINQLKKFKLFKIQILNVLNQKQRILNELCKKIKRNIPYEKDKNLFKKTLNYVYLSMKGINPNLELHKKFNIAIKQTLNQCRSALYKLEINSMPITLFQKKDHQICSILKKTNENSINQIKFQEPKFKQFKKQTLKFSKQQQAFQSESSLFRLSNQQFLAYNDKCHYLKWYNTNCFLIPRSLYLGHGIQHLTVLGKNIFLTQKGGKMTIYDILNETVVKQYASSNHKSAQIVNVLSIDSQNVLNFVTSPNQIVSLKFTQENQQLKMIKGIQTNAKCTSSALLGDQFVSCFQDKSLGIYRTDILQKQRQYTLDSVMKSVATIDQNTFIVGGQQKKMVLYDKRAVGFVLNIPCTENIYSLKKIYPTSILFSYQNYLKIFDLRVQRQLFQNKVDQNAINLQILSSDSFITSGKNIHHWKGIF